MFVEKAIFRIFDRVRSSLTPKDGFSLAVLIMNERLVSYLLHSKRFSLAYVFFFAIKEISCDAAERGTVKKSQESLYKK